MRKIQKDSIVEIINLLQKAQEHVKSLLKQQEYASVLDLLQQCQQGAIQVGTIIEESEGEGTPTVKMLEEYCELVFQAFESVQADKDGNIASDAAQIVVATMDRVLKQIEDSIRQQIQVRREVVFLPYKVSMWDSLESVWKEAKADPECDAYVIPIPYFDKNPDGSVREMHYEGEMFPDDVPVIHYESYDFATRRPDMIFIHNPYDEANYVTSVHPFFYSKNLKQYTDKLVYVPYFVLGKLDPEDNKAVERIEHFITVPGVVNADKVIVQSEDMKKIYVKVLTKLAGEKTKKHWEDKILGLGSPKFDKICGTEKEKIKVPDGWRRVIEKDSGERKKIVLYNTSVSALLGNGEEMLRKIENVLALFKENKDEVALLWRPHPLIKATIASMRPQLWEEYEKIVDVYKDEGWGIYDDSPDLDRAILLCDGYYGDPSSVVQLCKSVKKPILVQMVSILEKS